MTGNTDILDVRRRLDLLVNINTASIEIITPIPRSVEAI